MSESLSDVSEQVKGIIVFGPARHHVRWLSKTLSLTKRESCCYGDSELLREQEQCPIQTSPLWRCQKTNEWTDSPNRFSFYDFSCKYNILKMV